MPIYCKHENLKFCRFGCFMPELGVHRILWECVDCRTILSFNIQIPKTPCLPRAGKNSRWLLPMQTFKYSDRHKLFPNVRIISHNTSWGGHFRDHRYWISEFNGEVDDYAPKKQLIADAIKHNLPYVILRVHRNGNATNIACSGQLAGAGKSDGESTPSANCH